MTNASTTLTDIDFLQGDLDFSKINPVDFENLIFHLLDEMGFSNLIWRKGGEGNSATDGGRDLEGTFWTVLPTVSTEEKYWFEVKYRKNQLEKTQVQSAVINAAGNNSKDFIVIITNKTVSNPTLDWIKDFQNSNKRPRVTIWQGHDLEILLRKNPRTLAKFLPSSLVFSGRCKAIKSKFANLMLLPSGGELDELWDRRDEYSEDSFLTLAAVIAEVEYGDIIQHPWGINLDKERLFSTLAIGMLNIFPFILKSSSLNRDQRAISNGLSYLAQCLIIRGGSELTANVLFDPEQYADVEYIVPDELKATRFGPILNGAYHDLAMFCSAKHCLKLHHMTPKDKPDYFLRFSPPPSSRAKLDDRFLILNSSNEECPLGLVELDQYCPLGETDGTPKDLHTLIVKLEFIRKVIERRSAQVAENH